MHFRRDPGAIARALIGLAGLATLVGAPACTSTDSSSGAGGTVRDTLGNKFEVLCGSGICGLTPWDEDLVPKSCGAGSGSDAFVLIMDPLLSIYALRVPPSGSLLLNAADPSRPVACTTDDDCLAPGVSSGPYTFTYACTNGLCRCSNSACSTQDGNLLTYDVLTLCQADLPWPTACPYVTSQPFASRIAAVADACGPKDTCASVPPACRQPDVPASPAIDGGSQTPAIDGGLPTGAGAAVDGGV